MMQRRCRNGLRNIGLSAAVSARALCSIGDVLQIRACGR
jgi:hypothetical protein